MFLTASVSGDMVKVTACQQSGKYQQCQGH